MTLLQAVKLSPGNYEGWQGKVNDHRTSTSRLEGDEDDPSSTAVLDSFQRLLPVLRRHRPIICYTRSGKAIPQLKSSFLQRTYLNPASFKNGSMRFSIDVN